MRKFTVSSTRTQYIVIEIPFEKFPHTADKCVQMSTEPSALKVENRGDGTQAEHGKTRFSVEEVEVLVQEACAEATKRAFNMADERAFRRLEEFNQMYEDKMRTLLEKELTRREELTLMYEDKIVKMQALMEKAQMAKQTPDKYVNIPEEDEGRRRWVSLLCPAPLYCCKVCKLTLSSMAKLVWLLRLIRQNSDGQLRYRVVLKCCF